VQTSFSELEYASKKKQTRRDRFLAEIESVTPWAILECRRAFKNTQLCALKDYSGTLAA
jgi:hypothetical protein